MKDVYIVMRIDKHLTVDVMGMEHTIPLIFTKGMIGAIPVFETAEDAEEFADGRFSIMGATIGTNEKDSGN